MIEFSDPRVLRNVLFIETSSMSFIIFHNRGEVGSSNTERLLLRAKERRLAVGIEVGGVMQWLGEEGKRSNDKK
jgi:hypothetical protein